MTSVGIHLDGEVDGERLNQWVSQLRREKGTDIFRIKGILSIKGSPNVVTCLTFSPQKPVLATGSQDCSVLLWEPRRGSKPVGYAFMEDEVTVLAWNPQQNGLLAADAGGSVALFETYQPA